MRLSLIILALLLALPALAQPHGPDTLWTYTFRGVLEDEGRTIAHTNDGGLIVGGGSELIDGEYSGLIVRLDSTGQQLWAQQYSAISKVNAIASLPDGGWVLTGYCGYSYMGVVKIDSMGEVRWTQCVRPLYPEEGVGLAATMDGGIVVVSAGSWTAFPDIDLIRFTPQGDSLWTRSYGGAAEDHGGAVLALADGGFLLVGSTIHQAYVLKTDSLGEEEWSSTFGDPDPLEMLHAVVQTASGDFIVAGTQTRGAWTFNPYAARVTAAGDTLWTQVYPELGPGWFYDVAELPNGDLVFGGSTGFDFLLVLADASGDTVWSKRYGTPISDDGRAMCLASNGGAAMAGYSHTIASNSKDILVVRTDSLWRDTTTQVSATDPIILQPSSLSLASAPNPFNASTEIRYSVPHAARVSLRVYDLLGREVTMLMDEVQPAGEYTRAFDAHALPSGLYFARLESGGMARTQKLVLLK